MTDLTPQEIIDRIARGLELTRKQFKRPGMAAHRRAATGLAKRKPPRAKPKNARASRGKAKTSTRR
jgi:hypothetical protein